MVFVCTSSMLRREHIQW